MKAALHKLQRRCASAGVPVTAQRRVVMQVIAPRRDHPTVDQIHVAVQERLPGVSKATVYRNLEALTRLGLVRAIEHPGSSARFDPDTDDHHHFLCDACGKVSDLPVERIAGADQLSFVDLGDGLRVERMSLTVRGTCADCAGHVA